ncbi:hypothetical protein DESC_830039 [Desulfosarcina cetonica]|uniref:hypothetical protein n=1 Tax=Desulfosarcina cetonica TaxID=90730 RepID=UPI0006D09739|nr:hypothetical protein [Desulfosarcina cetonica]VTR70722.1 hypothetical protein DESC_830039 [Desulfosarcina cetonica]
MSLNTVIINDITLGRVLLWLGIGFGIYAIAKCYRLLFIRRNVNLQHMTYFVCSNCGWEGHISKFGTYCPKCRSPLPPE